MKRRYKPIIDHKAILLLQSSGKTYTVIKKAEAAKMFNTSIQNIDYYVKQNRVRTIFRNGEVFIDFETFNDLRKAQRKQFKVY